MSPQPPACRIGLLLLLLAVGACRATSSSSPRPQSLLSDRSAPGGRECRISAVPDQLPSVAQLVDSAALHARLAELWTDRSLPPGYAIVSLIFDENGWNARRAVIEHDLSAPAVESLQRLVFENLREVAPGQQWGVRLRVDMEAGPVFRVGRQEICAPRLRNAPELRNMTSPFDVRSRDAPDIFRRVVWATVLVDENGAITQVNLPERLRGLDTNDRVLAFIRALSFDPALADGIPIPGVARVPIPATGL